MHISTKNFLNLIFVHIFSQKLAKNVSISHTYSVQIFVLIFDSFIGFTKINYETKTRKDVGWYLGEGGETSVIFMV